MALFSVHVLYEALVVKAESTACSQMGLPELTCTLGQVAVTMLQLGNVQKTCFSCVWPGDCCSRVLGNNSANFQEALARWYKEAPFPSLPAASPPLPYRFALD